MPTRCVIDENDIAEDCKAQNVEFQFLNFELPMGEGINGTSVNSVTIRVWHTAHVIARISAK